MGPLCVSFRVSFLDDAIDGPPDGPPHPPHPSAVLRARLEPSPRTPLGPHSAHSTEARRKLQLARYVTLRKILPRKLVTLLARWYKHLRRDVRNTANFQQKTQRHEYFPEVLSTYLNFALVPFASRMSGQDVSPTYPFPITYVPGGGIHPHLDVSDNELSLTYQVQLEDAETWPLTFLDPRGQELSSLDATNATHVDLEDNDGIMYYGPDIVHWREAMLATLTQIVFAFREADPSHCNNQ